MTVASSLSPSAWPPQLTAAIFDVDGVLLASPHERAWREALVGFSDPQRFTTALYQAEVAGKPRFDGARAALTVLGVVDADRQAEVYAIRKQARLEALIRGGQVSAFPDALRFVHALTARGIRMAEASSSMNAAAMLRSIRFDNGSNLLDIFDADVCGRDVSRGKPDPAIFLLAAAELKARPEACFVIEDSSAGIEAACAAGMTALGIARLGDVPQLEAMGADLVVTTLDSIDIDALRHGHLRLQPS